MKNKGNLSASHSVIIYSSAECIWDTLTNPEKIKLYLFGSVVCTDWKVGSAITFSRENIHSNAETGSQPIMDKGEIREIIKDELLKFTYFSSQEGYEDTPENYSIVTYNIEKRDQASCQLNYLREHIPIEFEQKNQQRFLPGLLAQIKELSEADFQ